MIQVDPAKFIITAVIIIAFLVIDGYFLKKYTTKIPDYLLPAILVGTATIMSLAWCYLGAVEEHFFFYFFVGIIKGFAAVGVYQFYKQMRRQLQYVKMKKVLKKDRRARVRKIS